MLNIIRLSVGVILLLFQSWNVQCEPEILVSTVNGVVRGATEKTRSNAQIFAFYGIRYAEPPTGPNRFKPPIPVKRWEGIFDATKQNVACPQLGAYPSSYVVSEDCLLLDVFTKDLKGSSPVIVFIHGGGFVFGAKSDVSPNYLLERDVVLVSVNYRLHALGFFSTGTAEAPGNYGFKDQVQALKWVRENIHAFGGDPNLVTLNGHSAGGGSVSLHLASPMSRGLFQRAIVMSGPATSHYPTTTRETSKSLLERTKCDNDNLSLALECLRRLPAEEIADNAVFFNECKMITWNYDIETAELAGSERFLIEDPTKSFLEGNIPQIPIIAGISSHEFNHFAYVLKNNEKLFASLNQDFSIQAPNCFTYYNQPHKDMISKTLKQFYFGNEPISDNNLDKLGQLYSDSLIGFGMYRFASLASLQTKVYFYEFDFLGKYSHYYGPDGKTIGVIHGDELQYIFVFKKIAPIIPKEDPANLIIERVTSWWANFAATGNPNNLEDEHVKDIEWLPITENNNKSLYINTDCHMGEMPNQSRYFLWDILFPLKAAGSNRDGSVKISDEL